LRRRAFLAGIGALAAARAVCAQSLKKVYRLGFLAHGAAKKPRRELAGALGKLGWREGENVRFEHAIAGSDAARWDAAARALVDKDCDLIVVFGSHMALAAMRATKTIPLVMMVSGFPVEAGIVPSLAHPGGNITGMRTHTDELPGKWMELLRELVPALRVVGNFDDYVPPFSNEAEIEAGYRVMVRSAEGMGIELRRWRVSGDAALARALAEAEHANIDVLWFTNGAVHTAPPNVERIREFVIRRRLPMASDLVWGSLFKNAGAVMAYSAAWDEIVERTASFVDRILRGAQAGDLPVEQPTRFELVVNLGVAKAIGVTIPRSLLVRADRVIE
jgi:ABC-type uncharacterized transport system substrate-binding protein